MNAQTAADADLQLLQDRLARLQAELAAERAARHKAEGEARAKDEFLAMVAHELRAPLGAILGWAHILRRRRTEEEFESGLDVIEQSVAVQSKLIDDLLVMARMVSNRIAVERQPIDPREFVDAAIHAVRPAAAEKQLRLRKVSDGGAIAMVSGDRTRLQQVMSNLLANAVKFTPAGGCIEVALRRSPGWAVISVTDDGVGIAPEFMPHVFERFRQDPGVARAHGGLGLGLAIARHLVELHGGTIEAHSDGEGRGACFVVRLPLARD